MFPKVLLSLVIGGDKKAAQDYATDAIEIYQKAVDTNGSAVPMLKIADMYMNYHVTDPKIEDDDASVRAAEEEDTKLSFQWITRAAQTRDPEAMYQLGICYHDGEGTPEDSKKAFAWYLQAAQKGHAKAMTGVAICYETGGGTQLNLNNSIGWHRKAANAGDVKGQYHCGRVLLKEADKINDSSEQAKKQQLIEEGIKWMKKAGDLKNADALFRLGESAKEGKYGMTQSDDDALKYWNAAAELGHKIAQERINMDAE